MLVHASDGLIATLVAPAAGVVATGAVGAATIVVNDETGPTADPPALRAVTCQKYVVALASDDGAKVALVTPVATVGGGFVVPKATS